MTRENQISNAAVENVPRRFKGHGADIRREYFAEGAEWADSHPAWHLYGDGEDPEQPRRGEHYLIAVKRELHPGGFQVLEGWLAPNEKGWLAPNEIVPNDIVAWMPLPRFDSKILEFISQKGI